MTSAPAPHQDGSPPPGLNRMRRLAVSVLLFERVWPAIAPSLGLLGVLVIAALLDLPRLLPPTLHIAVLAAALIAVLALFAYGLRDIRRPSAFEADRRLEADSNLRHQPLAVLSDQPASGGDSIWAAHVARARAQITRLRLKMPRPMLAAADTHALRALILIGLAIGVGIAGPDSWSRLVAAFEPGFVAKPPPPAPLLQAWITPPSYTGLPPMFLKPDSAAVTVPAHSMLSISVTGGNADAGAVPTLEQRTGSTPFPALDSTSFQIEQELTSGGRLSVRRRGHEMAGWDLTLVQDGAPVVSFPDRPGFVRNGTNPQARLPWEVSHIYGVASLRADMHLVGRPDAPVLSVPIPLPGNQPKSATGARIIDLTAHPWAGLPVTVELFARDVPGLEGHSEIVTFTLPERRFTNAIARALVAVRRQLSLNPNAKLSAITELNRLSLLPEVWDDDTAGFINLRAIAALLGYGRDAGSTEQAQSGLWSLALHMEEGAPDRTARALEAARKELENTLQADKNGDPADRTDLDRRIQELQEALQKRLQALTEQARRDPESEAYNPDAHPLDQRDMQKLTDEMRDAARKGDTDTARDKLAQLEQMMEALKNGRPEHGQMTEQERKRAEGRQKGRQDVTAVQDLIRRQGGLLDSAQARAAITADPDTSDQKTDSDRQSEQRIQQALRRAVGALMQDFGDLTGDVPPSLSDADTAMRGSLGALVQGNDAAAAQLDQRAIEALQKGGKSMQQQLAQKFGRGEQQSGEADDGDPDGDEQGMAQGDEDGDGDGPGMGQYSNGQNDRSNNSPGQRGPGHQSARRPGQGRDPLGRSHGEGIGGTDEAGDVQVPEQMEQARSRELQDELRKRGADRTRPQDELDYIDRLLKQF